MKQTAKNTLGRVAVLYGGVSSEREISLISGRGVLKALQAQGVDAFGVDLRENYLEQLVALECDVVFNILHGGAGENGEIQAILNAAHLPYPGSGPAACAFAMDKWRSKLIWQNLKLPVLPGVLLSDNHDMTEQVNHLNYPLCVKPVHGGSTLGTSRVDSPDQLRAAYEEARRYDREVMVEPWVVGREFTVSVFAQELPILELVTPGGFYDYEAKYHADTTKFFCPCDITTAEYAKLQQLAREAFDVLGCRHWGRVDFMQDEEGQFWVLEVNTIPGMTPRSDVPIMANAAGITYEALVLQILKMCFCSTEVAANIS